MPLEEAKTTNPKAKQTTTMLFQKQGANKNPSVNKNDAMIQDMQSSNVVEDDQIEEAEEEQRLLAEEGVLYAHLECVKQEAQLITVEGELITKLENAMGDGDPYDMNAYLAQAEQIAK